MSTVCTCTHTGQTVGKYLLVSIKSTVPMYMYSYESKSKFSVPMMPVVFCLVKKTPTPLAVSCENKGTLIGKQE